MKHAAAAGWRSDKFKGRAQTKSKVLKDGPQIVIDAVQVAGGEQCIAVQLTVQRDAGKKEMELKLHCDCAASVEAGQQANLLLTGLSVLCCAPFSLVRPL